MGRKTSLLLGLLVVGLSTLGVLVITPANATVVYSNDFETSFGSEWSSSSGHALIISTTFSNRHFLGEDFVYGIGNDTVSLTRSGLPDHTQMKVSFDLYIIQSWDGNMTGVYGPDYWRFTIDSNPVLTTTFRNTDYYGGEYSQSYPENYYAVYEPRTGASETNTLGYPLYGDSVYRLEFTCLHSASSAVLQFTASGLQNIDDESWGIDNVQVEVVPLPSTLLLLGSGLLGLAGWRKLQKV